MSRIEKAFRQKAFIGFLTAGDPTLADTERYVVAMAEAGCDLVELGIPFSDPIAEGKVIQQANLRALQHEADLKNVFRSVAKIREKTQVPIVFLTYVNPVFRYGYEAFCRDCAAYGVDGAIIPDLPFEEREELMPFARAAGVDVIPLVAPTSAERAERIVKDATGFVYLVSSMGVTGVRREITTDLAPIVATIRKANPKVPVAVGFGISTPEQAEQVAAVSDGAIVGSAIVRIVEKYGSRADEALKEYVTSMKAGVLRAETTE